ncbi:MAG TPA: hypothetical protein VK930_01035 [Verrucomicrobiae bacterium]|nr:hypothetical protein [Verrucomicrobiae bacterium]
MGNNRRWGCFRGNDLSTDSSFSAKRGFVCDDIESLNARHAAAGNPYGLYIFTDGAFLSAVRLHDQEFVTLTSNHVVEDSFPSLDEWYVHTLRAEFGERYGLYPDRL